MTREYLLAMGEHPADIDRVLARYEQAPPPGGLRFAPCEISGDSE